MAFRPAREPAAVRASARPDDPPDLPGVEVVLFHDVLCAWSYVADQRLEHLRDEYGAQVRWRYRGYPLRPEEEALDKKQRALLARHFRRAAKEKEGAGVVADLWTGSDPPRSSLPPLVALEAARVQGEGAQRALLKALRMAAFLRGVNIARRDVLLEVAEGAGLDVPRFLRDLDDPRAGEGLQEGLDDAESMGIRGVPAVVIGDEWLMQGCRELSEYRQVIDKYLSERSTAPALRMIH
jgi:predicted DsbA family dithiol-disulfide isomerase